MRSIWSFFGKLRRALEYAVIGYHNVDYDYSSIERYLQFKLKRVQRSIQNGYMSRTSQEGRACLKSLRIAIKHLDKLREGEVSPAYDRLDDKWGKVNFEFTCSGMVANRPLAVTVQDKEQLNQDTRAAVESDVKYVLRLRRNLYTIMSKYITYWWD